MTREELATRINWHTIVFWISFLNPMMIMPQIYATWSTGKTDSVSLTFFAVLVFLQTMFAVHGFFIRDKTVMISNGLAAASTIIASVSVIYFRYFA